MRKIAKCPISGCQCCKMPNFFFCHTKIFLSVEQMLQNAQIGHFATSVSVNSKLQNAQKGPTLNGLQLFCKVTIFEDTDKRLFTIQRDVHTKQRTLQVSAHLSFRDSEIVLIVPQRLCRHCLSPTNFRKVPYRRTTNREIIL